MTLAGPPSGGPAQGLSCVLDPDTLENVSAATDELARVAEHAARVEKLKAAHQVHNMRLAGYPFVRIASAMGLSATKVASLHRVYLDYLRELDELGAIDDAHRLSDQRYEALLSRVWADAMHGDMTAIKEARAILDSISAREARVTAMITKKDDQGNSVTLVAEGSTDDYIRSLQALGKAQ